MDRTERQEKRAVNLADCVPDFLREVVEFRQLFGAQEEELGRLYGKLDRLWTDSLMNEAGIEGVKRYESLLGIRPYPGDSLKERRAAILLRWNQELPYTLPRLKERLDAAVGERGYELSVRGREYELELLVTDRSCRVLCGARDMVRRMIPANLLFVFAGRYPVELPLTTGVSCRLGLLSDFYARYNREFLYLDGSWLIDGAYVLNGYREVEALELYTAGISLMGGYRAACSTGAGFGVTASARAEPEAEAAVQTVCEGEMKIENGCGSAVGSAACAVPGTDFRLRVEKDLWYLDGAQLLDGTKLLDAEIFEYN